MLLDGKPNEIVEGYNFSTTPWAHRNGVECMLTSGPEERESIRGGVSYDVEWADGFLLNGQATRVSGQFLRRKRPPGQLDEIIRKAKEPEHV